MRALAGLYLVVGHGALHDDACSADVGPADGNTQPRVTRAPAARTYQHVMAAAAQHLGVDVRYLLAYVVRQRSVEHLGLDVHHLAHVVVHALSESLWRTYKQLVVSYLRHIFLHLHLRLHDRPDLQQVERAGLTLQRAQIDCKLQLHGHAHLALRNLQNGLQHFRQRERVVVEYIVECQHSVPFLQDIVVQVSRAEIVGRGNQSQALVLLRVGDAAFHQIEPVVHLRMEIRAREVQRKERGLRLAERHLRGTGLQHMLRMRGREAQGSPSVHDVLAQTQGYLRHTFLRALVAQRVEIQAPRHARERRIESPRLPFPLTFDL